MDSGWLLFYQMKCLYFFFFSFNCENRKSLKNCSGLKKTAETRQLNAMHDPGLVPRPDSKKRHS